MDDAENVGGDSGDGMESLDTFFGVEALPIVGWIERKKNVFLC